MVNEIHSPMQMTLTDAHFRALGRIIAEWTYLEWMIEQAIWELSEIQPNSAITLTSDMTMRSRLRVLKAFGNSRIITNDSRKCLGDLAKRIDKQADKRNDIIHAYWIMAPQEDIAIALRVKIQGNAPLSKQNQIKTKYTPERLEEFANEIFESASNLQELIQSYDLKHST